MKIADELGLKRLDGESLAYARHPIVYIVEAADDICYEVMDIEDAHKLKILTTEEVIERFQAFFPDERIREMEGVMETIHDPNEKVSYLRSCVIGRLVENCADVFVENEAEILDGTFSGSLISHLPEREKDAYGKCVELSYERIYSASSVVDVELAGYRILTSLMEILVDAVRNPGHSYSKLLLSKIPSQYDIRNPELFGRIQAVLDYISGMTDVYALDLFRKLQGQSLPAV